MSIEKLNFDLGGINNKTEKYKNICGGEPDCFFVLGQGVEENKNKNSKLPLKSSSYANIDFEGFMIAGKARVIAAAELSGYFPDAKIITNSRGQMMSKSMCGKETVVHAQVMAEELKHMGIGAEKVIIQEYSYSVFSELTEMIKLAVENYWKHIVVLTNGYQVQRVEMMLSKIGELKDPNGESDKSDFKSALEKFKKMDVTVKVVSAEDILPMRNDHYKKLIEEVMASEAWKARDLKEKSAVDQIKKGEYWKKTSSNFVRPEKL